METTDLLESLRTSDHAEVPRDALAAARAHRAELTPALIGSLDELTRAGEDATPQQSALACYALYLLAEFRETAAFPAVERLFLLPEDLLEELTGDILINDGPALLAATAGAGAEATGRLRRLAEDGAASPELQRAALQALVTLVAWGETPRDDAAAYLARYFHERWEAFENSWDALMLAHVCLDLGVAEAREDIRAALERHPPEPPEPDDPFPMPPLLTWEDVEEEFREGPGRGWRYQSARHEYAPLKPAEEACAWWHGHEEDNADGRREVEEFLPRVAPPKIGRNDPCPCGSGRKFKKCCGV